MRLALCLVLFSLIACSSPPADAVDGGPIDCEAYAWEDTYVLEWTCVDACFTDNPLANTNTLLVREDEAVFFRSECPYDVPECAPSSHTGALGQEIIGECPGSACRTLTLPELVEPVRLCLDPSGALSGEAVFMGYPGPPDVRRVWEFKAHRT